MTTPDLFLFVSHIGEDRSAALQIAGELEGRGIPCWIAPRDSSPGQHPKSEIAHAIEACRAMLLILSDRSNDSEYITQEITIAGDAGKVIIPFRIEEARPKGGLSVRLAHLNRIDSFVSRERAIDEVMHKLQPAQPHLIDNGPLAFPLDPGVRPVAGRSPSVLAETSRSATTSAPKSSPTSFIGLSPLAADPSLGRSAPKAKAGLISSLMHGLLWFGGVLAVLAAVASLVLLSRPKPVPSSQQVELPVATAAAGPVDLNSIRAAMDDCEADAKRDPATLRFLIIPLASVQTDWRAKSVSAVGNAFVLRSDDAFGGLKDGTLRIYPGEYDFRVLDQGTSTVFRWKPSIGVASFSIANSVWVTGLEVQFLTPKNPADDQWGSSFERPTGTCYWVSAVIDD
jgi:TIR domain